MPLRNLFCPPQRYESNSKINRKWNQKIHLLGQNIFETRTYESQEKAHRQCILGEKKACVDLKFILTPFSLNFLKCPHCLSCTLDTPAASHPTADTAAPALCMQPLVQTSADHAPPSKSSFPCPDYLKEHPQILLSSPDSPENVGWSWLTDCLPLKQCPPHPRKSPGV